MSEKSIKAGTIKRLHVDQHVIKANRKDGGNRPVLTIQTSKGPLKAHSISIKGESQLIYRPEKPLSCGATVWVETSAEIVFEPYE